MARRRRSRRRVIRPSSITSDQRQKIVQSRKRKLLVETAESKQQRNQNKRRRTERYNLRESSSVILVDEQPCCQTKEQQELYTKLGLNSALFVNGFQRPKRKQSHISIITISSDDDETSEERTSEWINSLEENQQPRTDQTNESENHEEAESVTEHTVMCIGSLHDTNQNKSFHPLCSSTPNTSMNLKSLGQSQLDNQFITVKSSNSSKSTNLKPPTQYQLDDFITVESSNSNKSTNVEPPQYQLDQLNVNGSSKSNKSTESEEELNAEEMPVTITLTSTETLTSLQHERLNEPSDFDEFGFNSSDKDQNCPFGSFESPVNQEQTIQLDTSGAENSEDLQNPIHLHKNPEEPDFITPLPGPSSKQQTNENSKANWFGLEQRGWNTEVSNPNFQSFSDLASSDCISDSFVNTEKHWENFRPVEKINNFYFGSPGFGFGSGSPNHSFNSLINAGSMQEYSTPLDDHKAEPSHLCYSSLGNTNVNNSNTLLPPNSNERQTNQSEGPDIVGVKNTNNVSESTLQNSGDSDNIFRKPFPYNKDL